MEVCYLAKLTNKNQYKILTGKLDTRNTAAHPSTVKLTQVDVEHYILDLINKVVLVTMIQARWHTVARSEAEKFRSIYP